MNKWIIFERWIIFAGLIALFIISLHQAEAGPFIDLDIGAHLTNYHEHEPDGTRWLGNENPIGIVRIGYQTETYRLFGPVDARVHGYYEHMSSAGTSDDTGVDVIMFGLRFE